MKDLKELIYYALYIISGIIFILSIPSNEAKIFLEIYSISNGLISILIIYILSKNYMLLKFKIIIIILYILCIILYIYDEKIGFILGYVFAIITTDYIATQVYIEQRNKIRIISFLFNILLIFETIQTLMIFRIVLGSFIICYMIVSKKKPQGLNIKNAELVILKSNLVYFGALYLITLQSAINLHYTYILSQIGLSFALKIYDYQTRLNNKISTDMNVTIKLIGFLPSVCIMLLTNDIKIVAIYIIAYIFLNRLEKLI